MSEYIPTIELLRDAYLRIWANRPDAQQVASAEFDAAMAAHDAEIRAEQIETDAQIVDKESALFGDGEAEEGWPAFNLNRVAAAIRAQLAPRPPAPELIPGVQAAVDALSIYRKG